MNINSIIDVKPNPNIGQVFPGDTVKVSVKVVEGDRERTQTLEGTVLRMRKGGAGATITIRRISWGVGVEHIFPIYSPRLEKVELVRRGKVRRAKLYYLRGVRGKLARIKEGAALKELIEAGVVPEEAAVATAPATPPVAAAETVKAPEASAPAAPADEAKK